MGIAAIIAVVFFAISGVLGYAAKRHYDIKLREAERDIEIEQIRANQQTAEYKELHRRLSEFEEKLTALKLSIR